MINKFLNNLLPTKMLKNRPSCIFRPKLSVYRRDFDKTKCMSFLIKDENFEKTIMKLKKKEQPQKTNTELVHNRKYLKTKIITYKGKINPKEGSPCIYILVILVTPFW